MSISKMARDKRSINFYADLNKLSTADLLDGVGPKKKKRKTLKGVFTAERLVAVKNVKVRISNDCQTNLPKAGKKLSICR